MPLIVLTGYPSSGKSRSARILKEFFEKDKNKVVKIISENDIVANDDDKGGKNSIYADSLAEKRIRGNLKSEIARLINKDDVRCFKNVEVLN